MRTAVLVDALAAKYGSINAASRTADIPLATLFKLKRDRVDVRISTLMCIARALDRPLPEVVEMLLQDDAGHDQPTAVMSSWDKAASGA